MTRDVRWRSPDDEPEDGTECVLLMRTGLGRAFGIFGRYEKIAGNGEWVGFLPDGTRHIATIDGWIPLPKREGV